jgi:predicted MFS family arabinose efflux permease
VKSLFRRDLNLIWWANIAVMICYTIHGALLPLLMRDRGIGEGWTGFALGMVSAGSVLGYLTTGQAIDRLDRRLFILAGGFLWAFSSYLAWIASSVAVIAAVRLVQGFAFSILYTATLVYAAQSLHVQWQGRMVGLVEAVGALAIAATPAPAYWLADHWGIGPVFMVAGLVGLLAGLPGLLLPRQQPRSSPEKTNLRFFEPSALAPGLVAACLFLVATAFVVLSPLVALRIGIAQVGLFLGLRALGTVPSRLLAGGIADRFGPAWAIVPGLLIAVFSLVLIPSLSGEIPGLGLAFLFGTGMGLASPALSAWLLRLVPADRQGVALNTLYIFQEGSGFMGAWVFGLSLEKAGLAVSLYALCFVLLLGLAGYVFIQRKEGILSIFSVLKH